MWWRWCVVDEGCGVVAVSTAEVVVVFACEFFWGASAGMVFPFPTSFLLGLRLFVRSFFPYPTKRHFTTYVTRGLCGFINVETRG